MSLVEPFLAISKAAQTARTPVGADDLVTYTIRITNTGSSTAYDLNITDTLPSGLTFLATGGIAATNSIITTDTNTIGATALNYGVSSLNVNGMLTITFTARVGTGIAANALFTNTTGATYSSQPGTPADERPYTTSVASAAIPTGLPALSMLKTATPSLVNAGELLTYTLRVTNTGTTAATGVVVTDTLPANVAFVSSTPSATPVARILGLPVGTLNAGAFAVLTVTVRINEPQPNGTLIVNTAAVTNTNGGPITPTSTVTTPLASAHAISVEKRVSPAIAAPGDRVR